LNTKKNAKRSLKI